MNIQLVTMWYNEEFLAPFFLNHYAWVDRIHIILDADTNDRTETIAGRYPNVEFHHFKFPDMMDDILKSTIISQTYRSLRDADYVVVVDSDEFIFPFDLSRTVREHLAATNKDVYFVNLWQIYRHETDMPLDPAVPVYEQRRHGDPDMESSLNIGYLKPIVVRGGLDIFWGIGNHYIVHNGIKLEWSGRSRAGQMPLEVAIEPDDMLQGSHWRLVDLDETIRRRIFNRRQRQSRVNLDRGLTAHYHEITEEDVVKEYEEHKHDPVVIQDRSLSLPSASGPARPEIAGLYFDQAVICAGAGDHAAAQEMYRKCLRLVPDCHDARLNLAWSLGCVSDFAGAVRELDLLLAKVPDHHQARLLLGKAHVKLGHAADALEQALYVLQREPENREAVKTAAEAHYALQHFDEARLLTERALASNPDDSAALLLLASIERTEHPERARAIYRRLAEMKPDDHQTRLFYATLLLSLGHFAEGWREFEQRIPTLQMSADILSLTRWHGQPLGGKSIVLVAEQGHGDALQFIRYAPLVARSGARVMVLCHNDQIRPLLATVDGVASVVIPKEPLPFLPDYYCPLMSLPFELGTLLDTIPQMPGYLHPDLAKQELWRQRLAVYPGMKVGIVWAGNRAQSDNSKRSVPFEQLTELLQTPGVTFFSLQVGPDALKNQPHRGDLQLIDWSDELHDFSDTAALVSGLDLVISICSAVTHLSGGLAVPTFVMLQYDADWRWLRERPDSPWYPSLRLFRQTEPGGWSTVLQQVQEALRTFSPTRPNAVNESAAELYQCGVSRFNAGDLKEAEACFRRALQANRGSSDALNGLATILDLQGEPEQASLLYREVLRSEPDNTLVMFNLANSVRKCGGTEEAEALYRRAFLIQPGFFQAWSGLGNLLLQTGRCEEAEKVLLQAVSINPAQPDTLCDLGVLAAQREMPHQAEEWFARTLEVDRQHPAALNHLGMLLMRLNRLEEAEVYLRRALEAKPDYWLALNNLGVLLHWEGRLDESEACHRRFIAAQPDNGTPHFNLSLALLSHGKFAEGWTEYEYRFTKENPVPRRHADLQRWQGEELNGATILIHAEQGYGDTIQFARYLKLVTSRGGRVILECQDRIIAPLFEGVPEVERVVVRGETLPPVDKQLPLMSLPLVLGQAAWREPVAVRYLKAGAQSARAWRDRLAHLPGCKIGLVWSGRRGQDNNHNRMIPPELFARLAGVEGVSFVNLLVGVDDPQADNVLASLNMFDVRNEIKTFADTAAILDGLDLLISVDTATSHLAGALGKEAWVMIPYNADWRWTFGLPACPLYPSVRLYRQLRPFAWEEVVEAVRTDLASWVEGRMTALDIQCRQAREHRDRFQWHEALKCYHQVLMGDARHAEALSGVGACLQMLNLSSDAVAWYDQVLELLPDDAVVHCNRALALLSAGRYQEGWQELQWRKNLIDKDLPALPFLTPDMVTSGIEGKSVLIHAEQGFGDTIQAIRYARVLSEKGALVMVSVPSELVRLLTTCPGVSRVLSHGELLPMCDCQTLMMDLPWLCGTTLDTIPCETPYLMVAEDIVERWRRLVTPTPARKIGLVWKCGGGGKLNRDLRSFDFAHYLPLLHVPDVEYYSLQVGEDALDSSTVLTYNNLHDLTPEINDFADTAALISLLDHVVTIDSAVAHLAGALGKPVSLLLPDFREWRWVDKDGVARWYPTVRIFAKAEGDSWDSLIQNAECIIRKEHCRQ